jgi:hypothetical protein
VKDIIEKHVVEFTASQHGSTDYDKDEFFVMGSNKDEFAPLSYIIKKEESITDIISLQALGYTYSSCDFLDLQAFKDWFCHQFSKKLSIKNTKSIGILNYPDQKQIFEAVEMVDKSYKSLRENHIIVNGKNFPVQLGEWYAKVIFGLRQVKSTSQRGFDFVIGDRKKVEVKIHWNDQSSPKGVKLKKSLVELSDYVIIMYVARNLMIRDVLLLDSDFVMRKFGGKGHTIFLKDLDVLNYFFSRSGKQLDKVANKSALMRFATPNLAMKLTEFLE